MKYIFALVLGLVIALLIINTFPEEVVPEGTAVATQVVGKISIFSKEAPAGRPVKNNDSIGKGDRVEVAESSRLELRLPDGSFLRLPERSSLTLRKLQFEKQTGSLYTQAVLGKGKLWAKIKKRATPDSYVQVITSTGHVAGNETVYNMDATEDTNTTINVYEGAVLVVSGASSTAGQTSAPVEVKPVSVQKLQQVVVSTKEGVSQPLDFDPKAALNDWTRWNLQRDAREGLLSITIAPATPTVTKGGSLQFAGIAHYPDNIEKDISSFATWSSSAVNIAKLDLVGAAVGAELGAATISAAIDDMNGSTVLTVSRDLLSIVVSPASRTIANGAAQQFLATGTFSDKTVKDITSSVAWRSSNTNVAFVDGTGRAVGGKVSGTAAISASLGSKRGSATLKVRRELVSITIMPESAMIMAAETQRFGAVGNYSDGTTEDLTEKVEWESSDINVAKVDQAQAGRVIGHAIAGSAKIKATFNGKSGSATITINTKNTIAAP